MLTFATNGGFATVAPINLTFYVVKCLKSGVIYVQKTKI